MKASAELCINKLSCAAAKSELAKCEKFDSELGELKTPMVWLTRVCQVHRRTKRGGKGCRLLRFEKFQGKRKLLKNRQ